MYPSDHKALYTSVPNADKGGGAELKMWGDNVSRGCRIADPEQFD